MEEGKGGELGERKGGVVRGWRGKGWDIPIFANRSPLLCCICPCINCLLVNAAAAAANDDDEDDEDDDDDDNVVVTDPWSS